MRSIVGGRVSGISSAVLAHTNGFGSFAAPERLQPHSGAWYQDTWAFGKEE
jgi:hypothetical protein